ncbi:MAG: ATP-binding protein [Elusimicrobia bacterium]|nr:ATP-binding protein [Elusimicrobiota bacterium]
MTIIRTLYRKLLNEFRKREISIIVGPRQVGKTFILKQISGKLSKSGKKVKFYNLEFPEDLRLLNKPDEELFKIFAQNADAVFIDEFHYIKNAYRIFKMIYDGAKKVKVYASCSSSIDIHKHLKESLAGRRLLTRLNSLSYGEFLQKYGGESSHSSLNEYMLYGGLPGLLNLNRPDEKIGLLNELIAAYIQKDIKSLIKEENIRAFNALIYLLAENQGSLVSENSLAREVGLTAATINKHISLLENTYVCHSVYSYAKRLGNELKKSKKIYFYDLGIRNALLKDFSRYDKREDRGILSESFIFLQLLRILKPNMEIKFWKTKSGAEIDFVLLKDRRPFLIEVKTFLNNFNMPNSFASFIRNYPDTSGGMIVSLNLKAKINFMGKKILFSTFDSFVKDIEKFLCKF